MTVQLPQLRCYKMMAKTSILSKNSYHVKSSRFQFRRQPIIVFICCTNREKHQFNYNLNEGDIAKKGYTTEKHHRKKRDQSEKANEQQCNRDQRD